MKQIFKAPKDYADKDLRISGWIRSNRSSNKVGFVELNDGTYFKSVQVVYEKNRMPNYDQISKYGISSALMVEGTLILTPLSRQPFEIRASRIVLEASCDIDYPLQKKRHSMEFLREIAHLRPRSNIFFAVFRVRSLAAFAVHRFFQENGYVYVNTPIITGSDCEGAGQMFQVTTLDLNNPPKKENGDVDYSRDFFGKETKLTVSGQLEGEAYALAFRRIYTFGPTFRAENSNTARHASEFWMIEPEVAFADLSDKRKKKSAKR